MNRTKPLHRLLLGTTALAILTTACSHTKDEKRYRGPVFQVERGSAAGWVLVSKPENFAFLPPAAGPGGPDLTKVKVVELTNPTQRTSIEIYLVDGGAAQADGIMGAVLRKRQRPNVVEGEGRATLVGRRKGIASIAVWRQTRESTKHCFYCVRVPVGDSLWSFVGTAVAEHFETARRDFRSILNTVKFHM